MSMRSADSVDSSADKNMASTKVIQALKSARIPDKIRNGRLKNFFDFYTNLFRDYFEVSKDVVKDARMYPLKASVYGGLVVTLFTAYKTNPNLRDFHDQVNTYTHDMGLVDPIVRDKRCYEHLFFINQLYNHRTLRYFNFSFLSLIWADDFPPETGHYQAHCSYLKSRYFPFLSDPSRIVDVGVFGRWRVLDYKLKDFDVNPDEWVTHESPSPPPTPTASS